MHCIKHSEICKFCLRYSLLQTKYCTLYTNLYFCIYSIFCLKFYISGQVRSVCVFHSSLFHFNNRPLTIKIGSRFHLSRFCNWIPLHFVRVFGLNIKFKIYHWSYIYFYSSLSFLTFIHCLKMFVRQKYNSSTITLRLKIIVDKNKTKIFKMIQAKTKSNDLFFVVWMVVNGWDEPFKNVICFIVLKNMSLKFVFRI